ncbi:MAG TPA: nucleoside hydrolase, partial [Chloroflexota bacterium]
PTRLILDTDIGTDVDDALALALVLGSPELRLEAVTCVYGDVDLRARMVRKLLKLGRRAEVPVYAGASRPLLGLRPIYWAGHEGVGLLEPGDESLVAEREHAVDYLVRAVMSSPGQLHLAAIGPLTNVALAMLREPRLAAALAHLTIMGGALRGPAQLELPYAEHNIRCDPEAAHVVMASGAPITLVPLDVTTLVSLRREHLARIEAAGTPFQRAVADQLARYPRFAERGATHAHDPLAIATIVEPELVATRRLHVEVETGGRLAAGATLMRLPTAELPANAAVALEVEAERAAERIVARIAA